MTEEIESTIALARQSLLAGPAAAGTQQFDFHRSFLALGAAVEVKGVEPDTVYEQYAVEIPAKDIEQDLEAMRKRGAERQFIEEDIQEEDMVKLSVRELVGDALVKVGGRESEFSVLMNRVDSESLKADLLSKKKGDTVRFNIFEVENHDSQDYAKKYFLNMTPEEIEAAGEIGPMFEGEIVEVSRVEPVELNQDFFDKNFGEGEVTSEAEAREKIKENISQFYVGQTEAVLFRSFQDKLLEENREAMPLPDDFLKRWLVTASEKNTEELVEKDYPNFSDNLRWSLIKGQLAERFEVKVEEEDIKDEIRKQVAQMMGNYGMGEEFVDMMVQRSMQDPKVMEETANRALDNKLFDVVKEKVTIQETPISVEDFGKILDDLKKSVETDEEEE